MRTRVRQWRRELLVLLAVAGVTIWYSFSSFFAPYFVYPDFSLEELLGILAVTTFLLGFASVRLQSALEESRRATAVHVDRVLEQNANQDLLPFPTSFSQYKSLDGAFVPWDITTISTLGLTWIIFLMSTAFVFSAPSNNHLVSVQLIHLAIVLIGSFGPNIAKQQFSRHQQSMPFARYVAMEKLLLDFLDPCCNDSESKKKELLKAVEHLDQSLPEWCWIDLIRASLEKESVTLLRPQLKRLNRVASQAKDDDDYSLIAFVWSSYLLMELQPPKEERRASHYPVVKASDLEQIMGFSYLRTKLRNMDDTNRPPDPFAEMALWQVRESRMKDVKEDSISKHRKSVFDSVAGHRPSA